MINIHLAWVVSSKVLINIHLAWIISSKVLIKQHLAWIVSSKVLINQHLAWVVSSKVFDHGLGYYKSSGGPVLFKFHGYYLLNSVKCKQVVTRYILILQSLRVVHLISLSIHLVVLSHPYVGCWWVGWAGSLSLSLTSFVCLFFLQLLHSFALI